MTELLARHGASGTWLATTDGDSVVPERWLAAHLRHAEAGARVVAGTVAVQDWEDRSSAVRDRARLDYRAGRPHHIHGANLSFAATAYTAAGGFKPIACNEDVQLVEAFRANAEPIAWATDIPVVTSARRHARAPWGFAGYLSSLERFPAGGRGIVRHIVRAQSTLTASAVAVHPAPWFRTGYLSSLLAAASPDEDVSAFTCQLVIEALAALGAWPARIEVVTNPPTQHRPMTPVGQARLR